MSEDTLWKNVRDNLGYRGHWCRIEYNVVPGIPDTTYCLKGVEGFLELKHAHSMPARATTQVFGSHGLRDDQVIWIHHRVRHGGRVYILSRVDHYTFLTPGSYCRTFNAMTARQLARSSTFWVAGTMEKDDWAALYTALRQ